MNEVIKLYEDIQKLTYSKCINGDRKCPKEYGCCDDYYCEFTQKHALKKYGIKLEPTNHPSIRFMSRKGCVVPPYLRPICAIEDCAMSSYGGDCKDNAYNDAYWKLREQIDELDTLIELPSMF